MAHSVKSLAQRWQCSRKKIYNMIDAGDIVAFSIGPRSARISDEEVARWERKQKNHTDPATLVSADPADSILPTSIM